MTDFSNHGRRTPLSVFADVALPAAAFAGVRTRRMTAFCLDFFLVSFLASALWLGLTVATFGLAFLIAPPLWPLVAFLYNGLTCSGSRMATPGMRAMDLEMRAPDGRPVSFLTAGLHVVLLYVSWLFPPVFLFSLVAGDKRCLHDIVASVVVVRRPDF